MGNGMRYKKHKMLCNAIYGQTCDHSRDRKNVVSQRPRFSPCENGIALEEQK